ncbi:MFS transporter [Arhodomonas sp. AD133]|uniref:MFS transporter n=1 Tax=Arhodomonas sp. AD133 TaxID=3415009 RepID=UPI003EBB490D
MPRTLISIAQLLLAVALIELGSGLQGILIPIRGALADFSTVAIGLLGSTYYAGLILGCLFVPPLVRRVGHIRAYTGLTSMAAAALLAHTILASEGAWLVLRVITGFGFAGVYIAIESWLNDLASTQTRGRVLAAYMVVTWVALIAGKLLFGYIDSNVFSSFALVSIAVSLAVAPVAFTTMIQPGPQVTPPPAVDRLLAIAPVGLVGCIGVGLANGTFWSLAPFYGSRIGLSDPGIAAFMAIAVAGGAVFQWPLGKWSDRLDRRKVMLLACVIASAAGLALAAMTLDDHTAYIRWAGFAFGAGALPMYALCVAHANDHAANEAFVAVSSLLLMAFAGGAVIGPVAASVLVTMVGPAGVFVFTAVVHAGLAVFVALAMRLRHPAPAPDKMAFAPVSDTSQAVLELDPRAPDTAMSAPAESSTMASTPPETSGKPEPPDDDAPRSQ